MEFLMFLMLAFSPGIFWVWFFVRRKINRPEPRRLIVLTFLLGMVSTIPAAIVSGLFIDESILSENASFTSVAMGMLFVVGPVEELSKFMAVRLMVYRSLYFDEPGDGLVYSSAASLGFASLENLGYIFTFGPSVMLARAPLSTLAHVIVGAIWGRALGLRPQNSDKSWRPVILSIGLAAVVHGLFNVAVFSYPVIGIIMVIVGAIWTVRQYNWARQASPFRNRRNHPKVACPSCKRQVDITSLYCQYCGTGLAYTHSALYCSRCESENRVDARYCVKCGDLFILRG